MSEEQGKPFEVVADEALEARIVSWVLGEVSEFEVGELERLCEEQPEMEVFRRRMVAVHGLAGEGLKKPETDWKLPETKRQKVLDVIGGPAREVRRERASRFAARRVLLAAAACLALTVIVTALVFPIFFGARAWKSGSDGAAADHGAMNTDGRKDKESGAAGKVAHDSRGRGGQVTDESEVVWTDADGDGAVADDPFAATDSGAGLRIPESTVTRGTATSGKAGAESMTGLGPSPGAAAGPGENATMAHGDLQVADGQSLEWQTKQAEVAGERTWDAEVDEERSLAKRPESNERAAERGEAAAQITLGLGLDAKGQPAATDDFAEPGVEIPGGTTTTWGMIVPKTAEPESAVLKLQQQMGAEDGLAGGPEIEVVREFIHPEEYDPPELPNQPRADLGKESKKAFMTRNVEVGGDFIKRLSLLSPTGEVDARLKDLGRDGASMHDKQNVGEVLRGYGLALPEQSTVFYDVAAGSLVVKAPENVLDDVQGLIDSLPVPPSTDDAIDLMAEMSAQEEPFSTFSLHVSDASFRVAAAALERGERPDPEAVRPEEFYNAFDYGDPAPTAGEPVACAIEQCAHPLLPSRNLVRVGVRTAAAGRGAGQPLRLTVMLDNSGSMEREDRRAAVQAAMEQLASLLGPQDVVTVLGFARQPRLLCDRLSGEGVKAQLEGLVEKTPAEGGTNLEQALALADELAIRQFDAGAQNRIVLLTDGAANLGNADPEELAKRIEGLRQKGVSFDAAGFGTAGMNDRMLERLTRDGNGRYYVVDGPEDAGEQFAKKLAGAFRPAAENVKVQVRFNPARVGGYRLIGFEEHRLKKEDFRNDAVDAAEMASEEAGVAVYQVELLPDGEGEIGEVSVRFRDTSKGRMVERSWTMPHDESAPGFDRAPASMQVAGLAVLAADALRDGPLAPLTDWGELAPVSNRVRAEFGGSEKVGQLLQMVERLR